MSSLQNFEINIIMNGINSEGTSYQYLCPLAVYSDEDKINCDTFDEELSINENEESSFSFKIMRKKQNNINSLVALLPIGRELQLHYHDKYYYFVIVSIKPIFYNNNIEYDFNCKDSCSYYLQRNNINATYGDDNSSDDEDDWTFDWTGKTIRELASKILTQSNVSNIWQLDTSLNTGSRGVMDFPYSLYGSVDSSQAATTTLDISGSNTYNGLIELANLFNACLKVEYPQDPNDKRIITFINKDYVETSNYYISPEFNLNQLDLSETGTDFSTIMYISGGEDAYENYISIVPTMPSMVKNAIDDIIKNNSTFADQEDGLTIAQKKDLSIVLNNNRTDKYVWDNSSQSYFSAIKKIPSAASMLYNFDYLLTSGVINKNIYDDLNNTLSINYRDQNLLIQLYADSYYDLIRSYTRQKEEEEDYIGDLAANYKEWLSYTLETEDGTTSSLDVKVATYTTDTNAVGLSSEITKAVDNDEGGISTVTESAVLGSTTRRESIMSSIENWKNSLWHLWANGSSEIGESTKYIETQINYGYEVANANNFIEARIIEQQNLRETKYADAKNYILKNMEIFKTLEYDETFNANEYSELLNIDNYLYSSGIGIIGKNRKLIKKNDDTDETFDSLLTRYKDWISTMSMSSYSDISLNNSYIETDALYLTKYILDDSGNVTADSYVGADNSTHYVIYYGKCDIWVVMLQSLLNVCDGTYTDYDSDSIYASIHNQWVAMQDHTINWTKLYNNAVTTRDKIWKQLITKYPYCFIESYYEDENQLDSSGLYVAAYSQFVKYSKPNYEYSVNIIDAENFIDGPGDFEIGDNIKIYHENLDLFYSNANGTTHTLDIRVVGQYDKLLQLPYFETLIDKFKLIGSKYDGFYTHYYYTCSYEPYESPCLNYDFIKFLYLQEGSNSTATYKKILVYDVKIIIDNRDVSMQITGISKKLRENTMNLTVSTDTEINSLIQKLLMSAK